MKTLQEAAQTALFVQNACNLKGIVYSLALAQELILNLGGREKGTDWFNQHPIMRMYLSKMHSLSGLGLSDDVAAFGKAYDLCCRMAEGEVDCY